MVIAILIIIILAVFIFEKNDTIKFQRKKIKDLEARIKELEKSVSSSDNANKVVEELKEDKFFEESYNAEKDYKIENTINTEMESNNISKVMDSKIEKIDKVEEKDFSNSNKENINNLKVVSTTDRKNNNILLTGSILIVLAAIVFLTSTWYTIPNILKTIVLVLFIGVFLGLSKIAKQKFNLEKTSKTFFNIAMAYIPICLIGISCFGLFGEYLSIRGDGRGIYLALVSTFLALLYYVIYKSNNSIGLLISSVIAQCSAIVAVATIIETKLNLIFIILLLYNIVLMMVTKDVIFKVLSKILLYSISIIFSIYILVVDIFTAYTILDILVAFLISVNYIVINKKHKNNLDFGLFNIFAIFLGNLIISYESFDISSNFIVFLEVLWIIAIYFFTNVLIEDKKKLSINAIISMIAIILKTFYLDNEFFKFYMLAIIDSIILTIAYIRNIFKKDIMQILIPIAYILTGVNVIIDYNLGNYAFVILSMVAWLISLFIKDNRFKYNSFIVSHFAIVMSLLNMIITFEGEFIGTALLFLAIAIYIVSYFKTNRKFIYKYGAYISLILAIWSIDYCLNLDMKYYLIPISSLIITVLEYILSGKINDKYSEYFILGIFGLSYLSLVIDVQIYNVFLAIIISIILFAIDYFDKKSSKYNILALVGSFIVIIRFEISYLNLIIGLILTLLSICKISKKYEITIFSFLYLICFGFNIDNYLILYFIMLIWSILHLLVNTEKKKVFRIITIIFSYLTYREILVNFGLDIYVSAKLLGIEIFGLLLFRTCFNNKNKDIDLAKYISFGILYLWAIFAYYNITDGMLAVSIMIAVVIVSYSLKDGAIVLLNLIAIIINAFGLTREFWLSIPWWIYLLVIGFVLIGFAIINEAKAQEDKIRLKKVVKSIEDKFKMK